MSDDIFIVAQYPNDQNIKDGMIQRIKAIDDLLVDRQRTYVNLALKNPIYKKVKHSVLITEIFINPILPFFIIFNFLLKAKTIYIHSIHPVKFFLYGLLFINKNKQNIILDAHGVVPEELQLYGMEFKYKYMLIVEKYLFKKLNYCICVSTMMIKHFQTRYPDLDIKYELLFTSELLLEPDKSAKDNLIKELKISSADSVFIYSGNAQLWQNIPLMMNCIQDLNKNPNLKIIILSGEAEIFKDWIKDNKMDEHNIIIRSVLPSELSIYYSIAHYGFVLRDDILINRVANPTKMLEYLQFGIIPIVLSPFIGDYFHFGYDFVCILDLNIAAITPKKSVKNIKIANTITNKKMNFNIKKILN